MMEFNRIITLLRKERGVTQKQAAEELGVSQALLSHYEKGIRECGLEFVVKVADYYEVSCDYLLGRSAERNGMLIHPEDIPNPETMKDSVYRGNVLSALNKKIVLNSLNVLFAKVSECRNDDLVEEMSVYFMLAVYKMFRLLYSAVPQNAQTLFSLSPYVWEGYTNARMTRAQAHMQALLAGEDVFHKGKTIKDTTCLTMTTESLTQEHPLYAPSLRNLIQMSENKTNT